MTLVLLVAGLAAVLAGVSTFAADRWGDELGGLLSAFPLIVGPVLLIAAEHHGTAFASRTAAATLLGLAALSGFALAYGHAALRWSWRTSLPVAWAVAAAAGALAAAFEGGLLAALAVAAISLAAARSGLPAAESAAERRPLPRRELLLRMAATSLLIVLLTAAGNRFGPTVAGALASLPTLASVLAVRTHVRHGHYALLGLLRGMLGGMIGFIVFCVMVGALVVPAGVLPAFLAATAATMLVHLWAVRQV